MLGGAEVRRRKGARTPLQQGGRERRGRDIEEGAAARVDAEAPIDH